MKDISIKSIIDLETLDGKKEFWRYQKYKIVGVNLKSRGLEEGRKPTILLLPMKLRNFFGKVNSDME